MAPGVMANVMEMSNESLQSSSPLNQESSDIEALAIPGPSISDLSSSQSNLSRSSTTKSSNNKTRRKKGKKKPKAKNENLPPSYESAMQQKLQESLRASNNDSGSDSNVIDSTGYSSGSEIDTPRFNESDISGYNSAAETPQNKFSIQRTEIQNRKRLFAIEQSRRHNKTFLSEEDSVIKEDEPSTSNSLNPSQTINEDNSHNNIESPPHSTFSRDGKYASAKARVNAARELFQKLNEVEVEETTIRNHPHIRPRSKSSDTRILNRHKNKNIEDGRDSINRNISQGTVKQRKALLLKTASPGACSCKSACSCNTTQTALPKIQEPFIKMNIQKIKQNYETSDEEINEVHKSSNNVIMSSPSSSREYRDKENCRVENPKSAKRFKRNNSVPSLQMIKDRDLDIFFSQRTPSPVIDEIERPLITPPANRFNQSLAKNGSERSPSPKLDNLVQYYNELDKTNKNVETTNTKPVETPKKRRLTICVQNARQNVKDLDLQIDIKHRKLINMDSDWNEMSSPETSIAYSSFKNIDEPSPDVEKNVHPERFISNTSNSSFSDKNKNILDNEGFEFPERIVNAASGAIPKKYTGKRSYPKKEISNKSDDKIVPNLEKPNKPMLELEKYNYNIKENMAQPIKYKAPQPSERRNAISEMESISPQPLASPQTESNRSSPLPAPRTRRSSPCPNNEKDHIYENVQEMKEQFEINHKKQQGIQNYESSYQEVSNECSEATSNYSLTPQLHQAQTSKTENCKNDLCLPGVNQSKALLRSCSPSPPNSNYIPMDDQNCSKSDEELEKMETN